MSNEIMYNKILQIEKKLMELEKRIENIEFIESTVSDRKTPGYGYID